MYRFILIICIIVLILIIIYNYTSEPFQNIDASGTTIVEAQKKIDAVIQPLIQANPDLSDV